MQVKTREWYARRLKDDIVHHVPLSSPRGKGEEASSPRRVSSFNMKPFGYSQEMAYRSVIRALVTDLPFCARVLCFVSLKDQLTRQESEYLAHSVVYDLFGLQREGELLQLLCLVLEEMSASSKGYMHVLGHKSFLAKVFHNYKLLVGGQYIHGVLGYVVVCVFTSVLLADLV